MSSDKLSEAIQLIQQGQNEQAQPILQGLIRANPQDLTAWSWFVKSCRTPEKRLQALEVCLKFNPDNQQIFNAVQNLREKLAPPPPPTPEPAPEPSIWDIPPSLLEPEPDPSPWDIPPSLLESNTDPSPFNVSPSLLEPQQSSSFEMYIPTSLREPELDVVPGYTPPPEAKPESYIPYVAPTPLTARETPIDPNDKYKGLDHWRGRPFIWYDVWLRALTQPTQGSYTTLLRDPLASQKRVYGWTVLSNLVTWLILIIAFLAMTNPTLTQFLVRYGPEYSIDVRSIRNFETVLGIVLIVMLPVQVIASLINLLLTSAVYAFVAAFMGGNGNFSRTVYLLGAWQAPYNIILGILIAIMILIKIQVVTAILGGLIFILLLYSIWLNLTSLGAAHNLQWEKSCIVIAIGGILTSVLSCIFQIMLEGILRLIG